MGNANRELIIFFFLQLVRAFKMKLQQSVSFSCLSPRLLNYCEAIVLNATGTIGIAVWSLMGVINTILLATSMIFCRMLSCEAKKQKKSIQRRSKPAS